MQVMAPFQLVKFTNSILAQQCESIGKQILNYQKYIDPIGRAISNRGGWQSKNTSPGTPPFLFRDEWTEYLGIILNNCYTDYVQHFYKKRYTGLYGHTKEAQNFRINPWININWPGDYNVEHCHAPVNDDPELPIFRDEFYYIHPGREGDREFWLPHAFGNFFVTDSHNTFFVTEVPYGPAEEKERTYIDFNAGDFCIGHPIINHGVGINKQTSPRITISFNFDPIAMNFK